MFSARPRDPRSCTAPKQGKSPRCELEGQVKMLCHRIYSKAKDREVQERGVWNGDPGMPEIGADAEFDLVKAPDDICAFGDRMKKVARFGAHAFGDHARVLTKKGQPDGQAACGNAPRNVDRVNGDTACFDVFGSFGHRSVVAFLSMLGNRNDSTGFPSSHPRSVAAIASFAHERVVQ